jgi:hypothetical protein
MKTFIGNSNSGWGNFWFIFPFLIWVIAGGIFSFWFITNISSLRYIGISSGAFNILISILITFSGVLLGLILAAVSFITQYSSYHFYGGREVLLREKNAIELWLLTNNIRDNDLYDDLSNKLANLCQVCDVATIIPLKIKQINEFINTIYEALKSSTNFLNVLENESVLSQKVKINKKDKRSYKVDKKLENIKKELPSLYNLKNSIFTISSAIVRVITAAMSGRMSNQLIQCSYFAGFVLIGAIAILILSAITLNGVNIFMNPSIYYAAIMLAWFLVLTLILLFMIVWLHIKVAVIEIDKKLSFK